MEERLQIASYLARKLMDQHGLQDWSFSFGGSRTKMGLCFHLRKMIRLSRRHVLFDTVESVIDTILHEIAHAKCGPQHGHNQVWRDYAAKIGATPEPCFSTNVRPKYSATCQSCGHRWSRNRIRKGKLYFCRHCGSILEFTFVPQV